MTNEVKHAEQRAKISAFLKNTPGKHPVSVVAQHLGISGRSAGQMLARMANNGLIPQPERVGKEWAYEWEENHEPKPAAAKGPRRVTRTGKMGDDDVMAILGCVAMFKRGIITQEVFLKALKELVGGA